MEAYQRSPLQRVKDNEKEMEVEIEEGPLQNIWTDIERDKISMEGTDMVVIMLAFGRLVVQEIRYVVVYVDGWAAWKSIGHISTLCKALKGIYLISMGKGSGLIGKSRFVRKALQEQRRGGEGLCL